LKKLKENIEVYILENETKLVNVLFYLFTKNDFNKNPNNTNYIICGVIKLKQSIKKIILCLLIREPLAKNNEKFFMKMKYNYFCFILK